MICVGKGDTSAHQSRTINPKHGVGEWIETRLCLITATKILTSPSPHCWLWLSKDQFRVHSHQRPLKTLHGTIVVLSLKESEVKNKGGESIRKIMFDIVTPSYCLSQTQVHCQTNVSSPFLLVLTPLIVFKAVKMFCKFGDPFCGCESNLHSSKIIFFKDGCLVSSH